jgi:hypothetical protein
MPARILRLAVVLAIVVAVCVLLFYAFLAALILVPILALLFFLFGRKIGTVWVVGQPPADRPPYDRPVNDAGAPGHRPPPPVIEHDPNDLPENRQ